VASATPDACRIERVDRDELAGNERLLSELYGLMVLAHYRTRPFDLRYLLDGPNIAVYLMRYRDAVVATAWVAEEGGFSDGDLRDIFLGRRRPHGHLLPEILSLYLGLQEAPARRCARVLRLAVHPAVQRRGLGTRLLLDLIERARAGGFDYLGSSFGATRELLRFWFSAGFEAVRLGIRHGTASGEHSAALMLGLNTKGIELTAAARERFERQFPAQLGDVLSDSDPELVCLLWRGADGQGAAPLLSDADWRDVEAFALGRRQYESCIEPLRALLLTALRDADEVPDDRERALLVGRVLQAKDWIAVAALTGVPGRRQALEIMRRAARRWLQRWRGV
jgi:tRNA(Met) cytidine acetyltransferase